MLVSRPMPQAETDNKPRLYLDVSNPSSSDKILTGAEGGGGGEVNNLFKCSLSLSFAL